MPQRKRSLALLVGILGVVMLAAACHKKAVAPPPPPPPAAAAPEKPTVNLTAVPSTIEQGQSVTLSWTSENATSLDLQPGVGAVQASGSTSVSPTESTTYTLTATGSGGTATSTARVTVTSPPPPPPPQEHAAVSEATLFEQNIKDAYFDYNKSDIRGDAQQALTTDADFLKSHPSISFTIEGHCDERGSEEYNLGLGDRRANAAKSFLVNLGIPASRITTISYGKDRPFCTESNEQCWQQNRRAHLVMGSGQSQ
ncbi:MAG TPA: peptidoglycan-associated lipoprotein Pal [Terriglobia bacterium]|nr:peptidoglycan-associated lipoprotein Pal [Terriglobia bacterium]